MSKHTPGPWTSDVMVSICGAYEAGLNIGFLSTQDAKRREEGEANARLIAAAPDLLAVLEAAVECGMVPQTSAREGGAARFSRQVIVADMIRDIITKVRGAE